MRTRLILSVFLLVAPSFAFAAPQTFASLVNKLVGIMDRVVLLLILVAFAAYLYGLSINILNFGENSRDKIKALYFWGIIALFVMVSLWGIVRLVQNTVFGGGTITSAVSILTRA